ncbi:MAG: hypothetical protein MAGBODY4_00802 [Candidatus Marinimicrobia bacterium]|nr:hypothetical protein [Candidatus Neomarinimicrobiota bacterium]
MATRGWVKSENQREFCGEFLNFLFVETFPRLIGTGMKRLYMQYYQYLTLYFLPHYILHESEKTTLLMHSHTASLRRIHIVGFHHFLDPPEQIFRQAGVVKYISALLGIIEDFSLDYRL